MSCNALVKYTKSLLGDYDCDAGRLECIPDILPYYPKPLREAMETMRRVIEGVGGLKWGDVRANLIESVLGFALRKLEMELQPGTGMGHGLVSKYAKEVGIEVLLSGKGGDEVFCGYLYLKEYPTEELFARQMQCIGFLHNNASLRLDRMNLCNSLRVVAPLISGELLNYAMAIPSEYKQKAFFCILMGLGIKSLI